MTQRIRIVYVSILFVLMAMVLPGGLSALYAASGLPKAATAHPRQPISGTVTDDQNQPLPSATVQIKGT